MPKIKEQKIDVCTFLAKRYNDAVKNKGHVTTFTYGPFGSGKSTYDMLHSYSIYKDWDKVMSNLIFTREELINKLKNCFNLDNFDKVLDYIAKGGIPPQKIIKHRIPCLIWDDATVEAMGVRTFDEFLDEFAKFYTVIRSVVAVFKWNGPSFSMLYGKLKSMDWTVIRIQKDGKDPSEATAKLYDYSMAPNLRIYTKRIKIGNKGVIESFRYDDIPKRIRNRYEGKRDSYPAIRFLKLVEAQGLFTQRETNKKALMEKMYKLVAQLERGSRTDTRLFSKEENDKE